MDLKLKNRILVVGYILSLFIVYKFTIAKTLEAQQQVTALKTEKELLNGVSSKIASLQQHEKQLDSILKSYNVSINNSFQQTLLQQVTAFSKKNNLDIIAFNEPHQYNTNITKLSTYAFEVRGNFIALLKMVNHLEQLQLGEMVSIHFEKKKNYRVNRDYLTCTILLQKVAG